MDEVFCIGSAPGDCGGVNALVNAFDFAGARDNQVPSDVVVTNPHDFNRDGSVNSLDVMIARDNVTDHATALKLIRPTPEPAPLLVAPRTVAVSPSSEAASTNDDFSHSRSTHRTDSVDAALLELITEGDASVVGGADHFAAAAIVEPATELLHDLAAD